MKTNRRNIGLSILGASVLAVLASGCGCVENEQKEIARARKRYEYLQQLADIDGSGNLSEAERILMRDRLDRYNKFTDQPWGKIRKTHPNFSYGHRNRIESAIRIYERGKK
jgi:hypothetical protein